MTSPVEFSDESKSRPDSSSSFLPESESDLDVTRLQTEASGTLGLDTEDVVCQINEGSRFFNRPKPLESIYISSAQVAAPLDQKEETPCCTIPPPPLPDSCSSRVSSAGRFIGSEGWEESQVTPISSTMSGTRQGSLDVENRTTNVVQRTSQKHESHNTTENNSTENVSSGNENERHYWARRLESYLTTNYTAGEMNRNLRGVIIYEQLISSGEYRPFGPSKRYVAICDTFEDEDAEIGKLLTIHLDGLLNKAAHALDRLLGPKLEAECSVSSLQIRTDTFEIILVPQGKFLLVLLQNNN